MNASPLRVLHCPDVVGGHAPLLARAERALGLDSWAVGFHASPYDYEVDETLMQPGDSTLAQERKRGGLLWRALREFDVVHFNFGSSLFPRPRAGLLQPKIKPLVLWAYHAMMHMRDLAILKAAGKAVFVTYQGDDARQGDYCRANFPIHFAHEVGADYYPPERDVEKRRAIARFARYADGIYALNPDLLYVLPEHAQFLAYCNVDLEDWRPVPSLATSGPLRIVHAPSHPAAKGTHYVVEAVERLKREGSEVELILVERLTRRAARDLYERADVVVDQLLAGWYGGFAVEAMALGKPVVAYIREDDLAFIPPAMRVDLPIVNAHPGTIQSVLRSLAGEQRPSLPVMGARARAYVEKWHQPTSIAANVIADYRAAVNRHRMHRSAPCRGS